MISRVVHASAAGAFGELEVTHDVSDITSAAFLNGVGKKSKVLLRISTVGPEKGSADTVRDVRGWLPQQAQTIESISGHTYIRKRISLTFLVKKLLSEGRTWV